MSAETLGQKELEYWGRMTRGISRELSFSHLTGNYTATSNSAILNTAINYNVRCHVWCDAYAAVLCACLYVCGSFTVPQF